MIYPGHTYEFLEGLTKLELTSRQRTITAELRDPKSTRSPEEKVNMREDLRLIEIILKNKNDV